jgi:ABC-type branched-subunit amino acid transport system ATPase component
MRQEIFDLSHDITLIYGANGTGKSSFFEALEVSMLGTISEAQLKRVEQRLYCNNARLKHHDAPVLLAGEAQNLRPVSLMNQSIVFVSLRRTGLMTLPVLLQEPLAISDS